MNTSYMLAKFSDFQAYTLLSLTQTKRSSIFRICSLQEQFFFLKFIWNSFDNLKK